MNRRKFILLTIFVNFTLLAVVQTQITDTTIDSTILNEISTNSDNKGAYKPVIIVHGILDHKDSMELLVQRISKKHPGTNITVVNELHGWKSLSPLWYQVKKFRKIVEPIMKEHPEGVHLLGFSQGGLVARALVQSIENHNIHNFISLSSPQAGQFGDSFLKIYFPGYVKETVWHVFYTEVGQLCSVANYWRDPFHLSAYLNESKFLPILNNMINPVKRRRKNYEEIKKFQNSRYTLPIEDYYTPYPPDFLKNNFVKLKKLIIVGGPDDGIISPWQSALFGYYKENSDTELEDMRSRDIWLNDTFGLKTLGESGRLEEFIVPGVKHLEWHRNPHIVDKYILPFLT